MLKNLSTLTVSIAAALMVASPSAEAGLLKKVWKEATRPVNQAVAEVDRTAGRVGKELERAGERVAKEVERSAEKVADETVRGVDNIVEGVKVAAEASFQLAEAGLEANVSAIRALAKADIEQAARAVTVDHWRAAEDIGSAAVMESSALRLVGQVAATAYGGPAGGSAFAGWYGYHASGGEWDAAAKSAAVTLAASGVSYGVEFIPGDPGMTLAGASRVAASGAGAAGVTALAGGDADAIRKGFWMGAATAAAAETYRGTTGIEMSGEVATEGPIAKDPNTPITDYSPNASHVGTEVPVLGAPREGFMQQASYFLAQEQGPVMQVVAKVPGMNRMAFFHDTWMQSTSVTVDGWVQATIPPAMLVSYMATGTPLAHHLQDETL